MTERKDDPLLKSAQREALICGAVWILATAYSVGYSWLYGYRRPIESLTYVFGLPDWIFWGVVIPWLACTLFSAWFCLFYMSDEALCEETTPD
ncbi:hypothetical protein GC163_03650 [bacterium]|nr:hypothetical protein [bacterium]